MGVGASSLVTPATQEGARLGGVGLEACSVGL